MKCIFCKEEKSKDQFKPEHVFPDSIGGSLTVDSVCADCNNRIGSEVDSKLADNLFVKLIRWELGLLGRTEKTRPLMGDLVGSRADEGGAIRVALTPDKAEGGLRGRVITKRCESITVEKGIEWQKSVVDSENLKTFVSMIQASCRHHGQPEPTVEEITHLYDYLKAHSEVDECRVKIAEGILFRGKLDRADPNVVECWGDMTEVNRAIVKIAYELAYEWLGPTYLNDPTALILRRFVLDPSFRPQPEENGVKRMAFKIESLNGREYSHMARICYSDVGLVCEVTVFNVIWGYILVTTHPKAYRLFVPRRVDLNPTRKTYVTKSSEGNLLIGKRAAEPF
jgi:hypothetical protein